MKKILDWFKNLDIAYKLIIYIGLFIVGDSIYWEYTRRTETISEQKSIEQIVIDAIQPPANYIPIGTAELKDVSVKDNLRFDEVVIFDHIPSIDSLDLEIRYRVYKIWKLHPEASSISVRCFGKNESWVKRDGEYKPCKLIIE